jgi:HK97 gp10 family phage protein
VEEFKVAMQRLDVAMQKEVHGYLVSWVEAIKAEAQKLVPVRTGYLQSTIYAKVKEWVAEVGADATYAVFVEFGTRFMQAHPFLQPAIQTHLPELESIIVSAIEQAKVEAGL